MLTKLITPENNLITFDESARILGIATQTLRNRISLGKCPLRPVKFGTRMVRFVEADVWALRAKAIASR